MIGESSLTHPIDGSVFRGKLTVVLLSYRKNFSSMKNFVLLFMVALFVVILVVGCGGAKDAPVAVEQVDAQPAQAAPAKELTIAEKEALYKAKNKADLFYRNYSDIRDNDTFKNPYTSHIDEKFLNKIKANPDFSKWESNALEELGNSQNSMDHPHVQEIYGLYAQYDYLINVTPELIREKTEKERIQVKKDCERVLAEYSAKKQEALSYLPAIWAELEKRREAERDAERKERVKNQYMLDQMNKRK